MNKMIVDAFFRILFARVCTNIYSISVCKTGGRETERDREREGVSEIDI